MSPLGAKKSQSAHKSVGKVWARDKVGAFSASGKGPHFRAMTRISNNA